MPTAKSRVLEALSVANDVLVVDRSPEVLVEWFILGVQRRDVWLEGAMFFMPGWWAIVLVFWWCSSILPWAVHDVLRIFHKHLTKVYLLINVYTTMENQHLNSSINYFDCHFQELCNTHNKRVHPIQKPLKKNIKKLLNHYQFLLNHYKIPWNHYKSLFFKLLNSYVT